MRISILASLLAVALFAVPASATIVVSLDAAGGTNVDTGVTGPGKVINFFIGEDALSNNALLSILVDFRIQQGAITGGTVSSIGAVGTPGYFGAGNLSNSDFTFTPLQATVGQEFDDSMQPLANDPMRDRWLTMILDTSGLASGDYAIAVTGSAFDSTFSVLTVQNDLTFTVTAIPEPGSFLAAAGITGICLLRKKRGV